MAPALATAVTLLAFAGAVADAKPLLTPGRHANPKVANVLSSSKRSFHSYLARYYGTSHGLSKPSPLPTKRDTSLPDGWSTFGCVAESYDERLLQGFAFSSSSLTPLLCVNECAKLGYTMAATEFGDECYCGSEFVGNGGGLNSDSTCNVACEGDQSETCGAAWYLNLYTYNSSALASCSGSDVTTTSSFVSATASATALETESASDAATTASATSSFTAGNNAVVTDAESTASSDPTSVVTATESGADATASTTSTATASDDAEVTSAESSAVETEATGTATATTSAATSTASNIYENADDSSVWNSLGCAIDTSDRVLAAYSTSASGMTVDTCLSTCEDEGYTYAGLEFGNECYCADSVASSVTYDESRCDVACDGDSTETCGGTWAIELYELLSSTSNCSTTATESATATASATVTGSSSLTNGNLIATGSATATETESSSTAAVTSESSSAAETASTVSVGSTAATTAATAAVTTASAVSTTASTTVATAASSTASAASTDVPSSSSTHVVWAHHMVGNTYPYGTSDWATDISAASAAGIDGFALNMGSDSWQTARVADAYSAAGSTGFKLFLSLDMTSLACSSSSDAANLVSIVKQFSSETAQATHDGKVLVSTFAGSDCGINWQTDFVDALTADGVSIFFVPSIFSDVSTFSSNTWMDGELNWNSGWPMAGDDLTTASDTTYIAALGDKEYMAAVSPFFYTHFSASSWNKNWLYRSDDWLYCTRWEQLIAMRETVKMTEILTWNDFGESSYIGPIAGALPSGSEAFVNGFTHTGLLELTNYYATAFKTGSYPTISDDQIFMWARPHSHDATASSDSIGKPTGWSYTEDYLYAVVLTTEAATVTLTSGSNTETFSVSAGLTKLKVALSAGSISGSIARSGSTVASYDAGSAFSYTTSPSTYNYNYFVGSSS
ncbi:hypothetical protein IAT38_007629 [Cryptococcus sp. DSM 104549]